MGALSNELMIENIVQHDGCKSSLSEVSYKANVRRNVMNFVSIQLIEFFLVWTSLMSQFNFESVTTNHNTSSDSIIKFTTVQSPWFPTVSHTSQTSLVALY